MTKSPIRQNEYDASSIVLISLEELAKTRGHMFPGDSYEEKLKYLKSLFSEKMDGEKSI
jgi:hypothetical protein